MSDRGAASGRALWLVAPGLAEIREAGLGSGILEVRTLYTGISRGTEALVAAGRVPASERQRMRCPMQEGEFGFPVKYGYSAVGVVQTGSEGLTGRTVFALHPHQDRFRLEEAMAVPVPEEVPPGRAILAANAETALNAVWDAGITAGDRVAVVGAGVVGALVGYLAARMPGAEVWLVDVNAERAALAEGLGCRFATPDGAPGDCDVVVHASATAEGLGTAIGCAGLEARVVEASWYGEGTVAAPLGGAFHSRRLALVSSQVGRVPAGRAARWSHRRRLQVALALLADPALEALVSGETAFEDLPGAYGGILADPGTLCHRVRY